MAKTLKTAPGDELYDVPLAEFVRRRNAIADRLRAEGRTREAKALRAIARPKATVWAINKMARVEPKAIAQVLSAFDRLKRAQLRKPDEIAAAANGLRSAVEAVTHAATEAIEAGGGAVSVDTHRRIAGTLRGAAAVARDRLVEGARTEEIAAPGFELFDGAVPRGRPRPRPAAEPGRGREARAREQDELAERRAAKLEDEVRARDREAERAASSVFEARQRLRELEAAAKAARRTASSARRLSERAKRPRGR